MAETIKCPVCGETTSKEFEFCQYCQSRLQPLTGNLRGENAPITPGQIPTKKSTADLEPVLPQWLRDARQSARDATPATEMPQSTQPKPSSPRPSAPNDFLAGLQSQTGDDDEEEVPDWLSNITGVAPTPKKQKDESSNMRWVDLGGSKPAQEPESEVPSWMQEMTPGAPQQPAADSQDWLHQMSDDSATMFDDSTSAPADASDVPDWMRQMGAADSGAQGNNSLSGSPAASFDAAPAASGDSPDWLRSLGAEDSGAQNNDALFGNPATSFDAAPAADTADWLRSLDTANAGAQDNDALFGSPAASFDTAPASDTADWLKSLDAQSDTAAPTASDTPDWLNSLGGQSAAAPAASDTPDWLNSLGEQSAATSTASDTPDWLNSLGGQSAATPAASDTPDWLNSLGGQSAATPAASDTPDWLSGAGGQDAAVPAASDTPDWLNSLGGQSAATPAASDTPDWLNSLGGQSAATPAASDTPDWLSGAGGQGAAIPTASDTPDWLNSLGGQSAAASTASDTPDWLSGAGEQGAAAPAASDTPDWLNSLGGQSAAAPAASDTPDWLSDAGGQGAAAPTSDTPDWLSGLGTALPAAAPSPAPQQDDTGDVPSWLKSAEPQSTVYEDLPVAQSAAPPPTPAAQPEFLPTPVSGSTLGGESDSLFTDMPDWLSSSTETSLPSEATEAPAEGSLEATQLPAWVQAMRPVEAAASELSASSSQMPESRGALAGLQGVLPAVPGYAPTSKPKTYSLKLQATNEQLSQAALLEQILAAETSPVPIASFAPLRTSQVLRWSLAFIFFAVTFALLLLGTTIFSLPVGLPAEVDGAWQLTETIPAGQPVLVAFDYEPARVGEMEAAAAPMLDRMALLKAPRLTLISTTETGTVLAERFMNEGPLSGHTQNGLQYINLGYLPGGQMGIRAFVQDPNKTAPFDVKLSQAWNLPALQGVTSFSNFAAFIIITDSADSARAWIEQISSMQVAIPVVIISSAQAAPMIQPYYASGQVKGLVSGLYGGAIFEQKNDNRPGTARAYWDAYSIGMLLAAALIVFGGVWSMVLGMRERAAAREAK